MSDNLISLRVKGHVYDDALISDGDIVVLKETDTLNDGELGVIWIKSRGEMVIRRWHADLKGVVLESCTPLAVKALRVAPQDIEIRGKVIVVIRQYEGAK